MKYRAFLNNKLWRDKMVAMVEKDGSRIRWRTLNNEEFDRELRSKMIEEASEVQHASTKEELLSELADVLEVIECLAKISGYQLDDVRSCQRTKKEKRGGFDQRMFVEISEHLVGSPSESYCLAAPDKYPEVK